MNVPISAPVTNNSLADVVERAKLIAKSIVQQQKEQRAEPYTGTLQELSSRFATANPQTRLKLNQEANQARASYLASGGSPMDLDKSLWGSDPSKGFQTGAVQFKPGYAGDNLSIGQKIAMAPIFGTYEGRPIFDRIIKEAALTGMFQGKPTVDKLQADAVIANSQNDNTLGWLKYYADQAKVDDTPSAAEKNFQESKTDAYKYFDNLTTVDSNEDSPNYGKSIPLDPKVVSNLKQAYDTELQDALSTPNPLETVRKFRNDFLREYGQYGGAYIINALENTLLNYSPKL